METGAIVMRNSNERHFIRECLALEASPALAVRIAAAAQSNPDWQDILAAVEWHGVGPLMYRNIAAGAARHAVPVEFLAALKRLYQNNLIRNMYLEQLLGRVLDAFRDAQVNCIVLKGIALAHTVYDDIALRPMGDLDLLIRREQLPQAEAALVRAGCELDESVPREWALEHHYEVAYAVPHQDAVIDLHWHISHHRLPTRLQIDGDALLDAWRARTQPWAVLGRETRVLSPTDTVLHLSQHFLKSRFAVTHTGFVSKAGLIQLCDIAGLLRRRHAQIDWRQLREDAAACGMEGLVGVVLDLALDTVPGEDPAPLRHNVRHLHRSASDRRMAAMIGDALYDRDDVKSTLTRHGLDAVGAASFAKRIASLSSTLFPSREWLATYYGVARHSPWLPAYYVIYPLGIFRRHRRFWARLARARKEALLKRWVGDSD